MKKVKAIFSLLLAIVMVIALAVPVLAMGNNDVVQEESGLCYHNARIAVLPCCGATEDNAYEYRYDKINSKVSPSYCAFGYSGCSDYHATKYHTEKCAECGAIIRTLYTESGYYCPTIKNYRY